MLKLVRIKSESLESNSMLMKLPFQRMTHRLALAAVVAAGFAFTAPDAQARDNDRGGPRGWFGNRGGDRHNHHQDDARRRYFAHPRSNFVITLGNGYAGRGYYYGPPNAPYYYEGSGISYYRSRDRVPRQYWGPGWGPSPRQSLEMSVQYELSRRGYYRGPVDGSIGPGSKAAIARYQRDKGLAVTGNVNNQTLSSLGLR